MKRIWYGVETEGRPLPSTDHEWGEFTIFCRYCQDKVEGLVDLKTGDVYEGVKGLGVY